MSGVVERDRMKPQATNRGFLSPPPQVSTEGMTFSAQRRRTAARQATGLEDHIRWLRHFVLSLVEDFRGQQAQIPSVVGV